MLKMRKIDYLAYAHTVEERSDMIAEIFVDDESELPATDGIEGCILHMSSIAYVIKTGALYVLGSDGKWYASQGSSAADVQAISEKEESSDELMGNSENV